MESQMKMEYRRLDNSDTEQVMAFLLRDPVMNVVLLSNTARFGLEQGESPFQADCFGGWGGSGLQAVGALYNIGAFFFRAESPGSISGMAPCIAGLGRVPGYTAGTRGHVVAFLEELSALVPVTPALIESVYMVLRNEVPDFPRAGEARTATPDDLDAMVRMQADFELEAFGKTVVEEESLRRLLAYQVGEGGAMVVEVDGRIVSKAEATVAGSHGALVGGVYTLKESRGQGYSTACMGALCRSLLSRVPAVGLNVFVENRSARRVYEKTGFEVAEDWLTVEMA
jgi:predicted GNAT family acetyltransferase